MSTVRPGHRPVLLVVDVQVGVVAEAWETPRVVANVALAVKRAREAGVPVIWVQHEDGDLVRGTDPWQLVPELAPQEGEARIFKRFGSSFEQTDLEARLAAIGATHVILAGACTNWCIRATAYAALDRGYDLTLVKDAHTTLHTDLGEGRQIAAADIVTDLNITMTWLDYPGRKSATARAGEIAFDAVPGAA